MELMDRDLERTCFPVEREGFTPEVRVRDGRGVLHIRDCFPQV